MDRDRCLDIAVTGVGGRFPGAPNLAAWWTALTEGRVLTARYDLAGLRAAGVPEALLSNPEYVPVSGYLDDADRFEHTFFRVSPRDAEIMDPQHRLMLEVAWNALEDAGQKPGGLTATAVYASGSGGAYQRAMLAGGRLDPADLEQVIHGNEPDFIASLISYKLGLTGPAIAVQTACSSGLVAVHLAIQALLNGDCDQALVVAAGVDYPQQGHLHIPGGIHSRCGACRPFDAEADGVVAGNGVAAVVLRRLADAEADGSQPYGVILGTAVNNDGGAKAGYYAPSAAGQQAVIRAAFRAADVDAASIGYLETHGTGTRVGDVIEWSAASSALSGLGAAPGQVAVGALKANTGHLDAAAGLASLIRALLVVREGIIAPVAGFTRLNPLLPAQDSPLYLPTEATPWSGPEPRRAGVSAFGIGGTNVHVVIEQSPPPGAAPLPDGASRLVLLSAADPQALDRSAARLAEHLATHKPDLGEVAFTLTAGRAELQERLAVTGRDGMEIAAKLSIGTGCVRNHRPIDGPAPLVFAFPGQGPQYPGMAIALLKTLPGFAAALETCLAAFGHALATRLHAALLDPQFPAADLNSTELAQPALFAVEYAAATSVCQLGITPTVVVGHSLGEITAACVAGMLELSDAAHLVTARGQAMQSCPPGAMLALGCDEAQARALIAGTGLEIAAVNTPDACVVAGPPGQIEALRAKLGSELFTSRLPTARAFHSALIEPAIPHLTAALNSITLHSSILPLASNVSGCLLPAGTTPAATMFASQARRPVRFAAALAAIAAEHPNAVFLEAGPGRVLAGMAAAAGLNPVSLSPARTDDPESEVLDAIGALWTLGQPLRTSPLCPGERRIHLPGYPFHGPRWLAPEAAVQGPAPAETIAPQEETAEPMQVPDLLASLWVELLGHPVVSADSDFFELGGDSLLIINLARRLHQRLGIQVPVRTMLASRTLGRQTKTVLDSLAGHGQDRL